MRPPRAPGGPSGPEPIAEESAETEGTGEGDELFEPEPIALPIDGVLDLHTFRPGEVAELVGDYLDECRRLGVLEVRIIHGKGKGTLRRTVEAVLARRSDIREQRLAPPERGGWGATLVTLAPLPPGAEST